MNDKGIYLKFLLLTLNFYHGNEAQLKNYDVRYLLKRVQIKSLPSKL